MNAIADNHGIDAPGTRQFLRAGTADLHARVDACFAEGLTSHLAYGRYLVGMHRFAADHEVVVDALPRLSFWLAADLQQLRLTPLPPSGYRGRAADPEERLGWDYVMAGSSLGARYLVRGAQALGHGEDAGARFLTRHAASSDWARVLERLDAHGDCAQATRQRLLQGARDAFGLVESCFQRSLGAMPAPIQEPAA